MTDYPFDVQSCSLRFGSWSYDTKRLDLHFMDGFEVCSDVPHFTHSKQCKIFPKLPENTGPGKQIEREYILKALPNSHVQQHIALQSF